MHPHAQLAPNGYFPCFPTVRVKQYEGKLAALGAINSALQKENGGLRKELDRARAQACAVAVA